MTRGQTIAFWICIILVNLTMWVILPVALGDYWVADISNVKHFEKEAAFSCADVMDVELRLIYIFRWKKLSIKVVRSNGLWYEHTGNDLIELSWRKHKALLDAWEEKYSENAKRNEGKKKRTLELIGG